MSNVKIAPKKPQQIVQNKIYTIYGKTGSGKTLFATYLASMHRRIYSNWEIRRYGQLVSNSYDSFEDLQNIPFSSVKGCACADEQGVNNNSRRSGSDNSLDFAKFLILSRKANLNVIQISQLERMMDVYGRELSECSFTMHSWYVSNKKLMFEFEVEIGGVVQGSKFVDLFKWMEIWGYEYNTLDTGVIEIKNKYTREKIDTLDLSSNLQFNLA